jgi:hypothetical protein
MIPLEIQDELETRRHNEVETGISD